MICGLGPRASADPVDQRIDKNQDERDDQRVNAGRFRHGNAHDHRACDVRLGLRLAGNRGARLARGISLADARSKTCNHGDARAQRGQAGDKCFGIHNLTSSLFL